MTECSSEWKECGLFVEFELFVCFCLFFFFRLFLKDGCVFVFQDVGVNEKNI